MVSVKTSWLATQKKLFSFTTVMTEMNIDLHCSKQFSVVIQFSEIRWHLRLLYTFRSAIFFKFGFFFGLKSNCPNVISN